MDDIIEELQQRSEPVPVPLELPSEDDLVEVEQQLFLPLPRDYRVFLLEASNVVLGAIEPSTAADPHAHNYIPDVAAQAWDAGLPRHLIPICEIRDGYYCIDPEGTVGLWRAGSFSPKDWESIWEWARDVWLASVDN